MAFDEVRLREDVELGAEGGPRFKTTVLTLASGHEKRNIDWSEARGDWDVSYGISSRTDLASVIDFFWARQGRARGARSRDADLSVPVRCGHSEASPSGRARCHGSRVSQYGRDGLAAPCGLLRGSLARTLASWMTHPIRRGASQLSLIPA